MKLVIRFNSKEVVEKWIKNSGHYAIFWYVSILNVLTKYAEKKKEKYTNDLLGCKQTNPKKRVFMRK